MCSAQLRGVNASSPGKIAAPDGTRLISPTPLPWEVSRYRRVDDVMLVSGHNISTMEVESALVDHEAVAEAAVVGKVHEIKGQAIAAFVTLRPDADAGADDLVAWCRERMAGYKYPRQVHIRRELPKGPTGKVIKSALTP